MSKQLIRSSKPVFPKEDINQILLDVREVLENGQFRNGKNVSIFEKMVARYVGVGNAVAFDSDSSAYETVLRYYGVDNGEVVVCTNSFVSVPNSVVAVGGKVVFADICEDTLSMDPESLRQNISPNSRGVIVTHIAGFPNPDLKEIMAICKEHGLFLVEDATHAIGATINNQKAGSFGDAAVFAFTPTKVLTTGEGGMLVSDNAALSEFAKRYSFYGSGTGKTNFVDLGRHMVLPEISAILGIYQLKRLEEFINRRNEIAKSYNEALEKVDAFQTIKCPAGYRSSYYKYPLILDAKIDKAEFTRMLFQDFGVETGNIFYPPCHLQAVYKKLGAFSYGGLSTAERVLSRTITLPMHVGLTDEDVEYVLDRVKVLARKSS
ncbi:MAG: DegT/DnrJ/EryC1/StrS family aminotransferase [Candidatus Bathyarchaeota archaeon]|nr:DegT/DnrJ/EryC1/StrS family aminotransferase [Candidatus Bathyarchaeota archaeon]